MSVNYRDKENLLELVLFFFFGEEDSLLIVQLLEIAYIEFNPKQQNY